MKFFLPFLLLVAVSRPIYAQSRLTDTLIVYKVLPKLFYMDFHQQNALYSMSYAATNHLFDSSRYLTRDQLADRVKNDQDIEGLLQSLFALEDEYVRLGEHKDAFCFYIYLSGYDWGDEAIKSSYLGVGDYVYHDKPSWLKDDLQAWIRDGRLKQTIRNEKFTLHFEKPLKLEEYYYYHPPVHNQAATDYHVSFSEYKRLLEGNRQTSPRASIGDAVPVRNANSPYRDGEAEREAQAKAVADSLFKLPINTGDNGMGGGKSSVRELSMFTKDSIDILADKVNEVIRTYTYFVPQFLTGEIMLRALPQNFPSSDITTYYTIDNLPKSLKRKNKKIIDFDVHCRILKASLHNREINPTASFEKGIGGAQEDFQRLFKDVDAIKIVYVNGDLIHSNPWKSTFAELEPVVSNFVDSVDREIFKTRTSLVDRINSVNYTDPALKHFDIPDLLSRLNQQAVEDNLCGLDSALKIRASSPTISYEIDDTKKLWIQTSTSQGRIYVSPFLVRAAFTNSLERNDLFDLAYHQTDLKAFFGSKSNYISVQAIHNLYDNKIYDDYLQTMRFVLGHEIAHIYLQSVQARDREGLCDCYALYNLKKQYTDLNVGVFETLLVKSVQENAVRFWGPDIDQKDILNRYKFLKAYLPDQNKLSPAACDALFR